jgi:hypothetical protein
VISTQEAEAGGSCLGGQLELRSQIQILSSKKQKKVPSRAGEYSSVVEHLPSIHEALGSSSTEGSS